MRKILICVVVGLMLICSGLFIVKGFGKINVKGITGLKEKDTEIEAKIAELSNEINSSYTEAEKELKNASNKLIDIKTEYENQYLLSSSNGSSYISALEPYDIDYLWTRLGNYAKSEGVVIKIDVTSGGSAKLYNMNFTVTGAYSSTTDFIYDIEDDSNLGFKIDNFKMSAGGNSDVTASFVCKDIPISVGNIENSSTGQTQETTSNATNNSNTSNAATNNNTTNNNNTNNNTSNNTTNNSTQSSTNSTSSSAADQYGISDPNKSNLTSIDQVVKK